MEEKDIFNMVLKESTWAEIIEYVITEEGMDPWNIDIVKLADAFADYVKNTSKIDFRIPARVIIIAAVLLKMKIEILIMEEEKKAEEKKNDERIIDISKVPDIDAPIKRISRRKVTLDELVGALEKAFRTKKIRENKKIRARRKVEELINGEYIDIEKRIEDLYSRINGILSKLKKGEITFTELVPKWQRNDIVDNFLPLLYLSNEGKIICEQKELFKEIYIKIKGSIDDLDE